VRLVSKRFALGFGNGIRVGHFRLFTAIRLESNNQLRASNIGYPYLLPTIFDEAQKIPYFIYYGKNVTSNIGVWNTVTSALHILVAQSRYSFSLSSLKWLLEIEYTNRLGILEHIELVKP
jgi:hypothetical protein